MKRLAVLAGALLFAASALDVTPSFAQESDGKKPDAQPNAGAAEPAPGNANKPAAQAPVAKQPGGNAADKKAAAGNEDKEGGRDASKQSPNKEKAAESKAEKREDRDDRKTDRNEEKRDSKDDAAKSDKDDNKKAREAKDNGQNDNGQKGKDAKEAKDDAVKSGSKEAKDDAAKLPDGNKAAAGAAAKDVKKDSATDKTPDAARPGDNQARDQRDRDGQRQQRDQASGSRAAPDRVRQVTLPQEKRDRVRNSFRRIGDVRQVNNVSIEISIGRRLPSDWDYRPVPIDIIEIVPEYRGYEFAYVEDRYVIVEPDTHEVVYVIDSDGSGPYSQQTAAAGRAEGTAGRSDEVCPANFTFQKDERDFILEKIEMQKAAAIEIDDVKIGLVLPGDMKFERFPEEVTRRFSVLETCRYVVLDDSDAEIAIIDPNDKKVVLLIEVSQN